jgi:bifunctional DNA-binding transcriptional regulator/antitoxin component of YhaV-PrlF toxin-antitoxin module
VLIPIELRRALDLAEGTSLVARVEDDRLILERPDALLERAKARFASIADGASLADELVAERRRESESERHPS